MFKPFNLLFTNQKEWINSWNSFILSVISFLNCCVDFNIFGISGNMFLNMFTLAQEVICFRERQCSRILFCSQHYKLYENMIRTYIFSYEYIRVKNSQIVLLRVDLFLLRGHCWTTYFCIVGWWGGCQTNIGLSEESALPLGVAGET